MSRLYISFGKASTQVLGLFFNWVFIFLLLSCRDSFYILGTNPYQLTLWFANIASHPGRRLFTLQHVFRCTRVFYFDVTKSPIFSAAVCALGVTPTTSWSRPRASRFAPAFPSKSFLDLALMFRPVIHVELAFELDAGEGATSSFCPWKSSLPSTAG